MSYDFTKTDPTILAKWLFRFDGRTFLTNGCPPIPGEVGPPSDNDPKVSTNYATFAEGVQKNIANWIKYEREMAARAAKEGYAHGST